MATAECCILSPHEQRVLEEQQGIQSYAGRERVFAILNSFKGARPTIDVERAALLPSPCARPRASISLFVGPKR